MKTTCFLMLIAFNAFILFISCSGKKNETDKSTQQRKISIAKTDTIADEEPSFFQLPDLQKLADASPNLRKEAFGNNGIRYIAGDAIILSAGKKLTYLNLLPKTSEDNNYYIQLVAQDWGHSEPEIVKTWTINDESGNIISLKDFYKSYKDEIASILKEERIPISRQRISFRPYHRVKDIVIKNTYKNIGNELRELNTVAISSGNKTIILLKKNSGNIFCPECGSLPIYQTDILGELSIEKQKEKILLMGFLEHMDQSPSALHIRFIDCKDL